MFIFFVHYKWFMTDNLDLHLLIRTPRIFSFKNNSSHSWIEFAIKALEEASIIPIMRTVELASRTKDLPEEVDVQTLHV